MKQMVQECVKNRVLVLALVAIAGTTETGSIDSIDEVVALGKEFGIHVHVDAAWGGPLIFARDHRRKLKGIEWADSTTIDGHKQLYTPMGLGVCLLRNPADSRVVKKTAGYVIREGSRDMGKFTMEGSRPANVLYLHASLSLLGRDGLGTLITRNCTLVKQMAQRLSEFPGGMFECLHVPQTNLLLFRYFPSWITAGDDVTDIQNDELNDIVERMQERQSRIRDGQPHGFVSRTTVTYQGRETRAFRVVIANPLTKWDDIENIILDLRNLGKMIEREMEDEKREKKVLTQYRLDHWWVGFPFDI
jgi:glutamate/tyrosine decarboxylase-like PLP-dependent enzyme